jgi:hypothetical protein
MTSQKFSSFSLLPYYDAVLLITCMGLVNFDVDYPVLFTTYSPRAIDVFLTRVRLHCMEWCESIVRLFGGGTTNASV